MPKVEIHIVEKSEKPGGTGETGVPPIAPAVANALFAAIGARVRSLPMTPKMICAALGIGKLGSRSHLLAPAESSHRSERGYVKRSGALGKARRPGA